MSEEEASTGGRSEFRERDVDFDPKMSSAEALMWRVASDPWLDPSGSLVAPLDQPVDMEHLRAKVANGITAIPRLVERVVDGSHILDAPRWELDPDFDLDNHITEVDVAAPGDDRALLDMATELHSTPYDPSRSPWLMYSVRGMADGKGALIARLHHSMADGIGALRMSEIYIDLEREPDTPPLIDLAALLEDRAAEAPAPPSQSVADLARSAVSASFQLARSAAGEAALIGADPTRLREATGAIVDGVRSTLGPLVTDGDTGSELWTERSGERRMVTATMPLDAAKQKARAWGGTINDLFVTALAETAAQLHIDAGLSAPALSMSYVRSTRSGSGMGGNAFTPTPITAPAGALTSKERFDLIRAAMAPSESSGSAVSLDAVGAVAALLPSAAISRLGRQQGRRLDIITSNLRSAPVPLYIGKALVEATFPIGPVAGAACNATLMSYNGVLDIGIMIDPAAITDPDEFRDQLQEVLDRFAAEDD